MQILRTENYNIFTKPSYTRKITNSAVNRLIYSITKNGFLVNPIIVNENMEVIDGNHRLEAARKVKTGVYFVIRKGFGFEEHLEMNGIQSNWKTKDFAKSYSDLGIESYVKLTEFNKLYDEFSLYTCINLLNNTAGFNKKLSGRIRNKAGNNVNMELVQKNNFQEGTWEVSEEMYDNAIYYADQLRNLEKYIGNLYFKNSFVLAWITANHNSKFSYKRIIKKLDTYPDLCNNLRNLNSTMNQGDYLEELREIYNYKESVDKVVNLCKN